jgi:hypothetical protein
VAVLSGGPADLLKVSLFMGRAGLLIDDPGSVFADCNDGRLFVTKNRQDEPASRSLRALVISDKPPDQNSLPVTHIDGASGGHAQPWQRQHLPFG